MPFRLLDRLRRAPPRPAAGPAAQAEALLDRLSALRALPETAGAGALRLSHQPADASKTLLMADGLGVASRESFRLMLHPAAESLRRDVQALPHPLALLDDPAGRAWFLPDHGLARLHPGAAPARPSPGARALPDGVWTLVAGPASAHMRLSGRLSFADAFPDLRGMAFGGPDGTPLGLAAVAAGRAVLLARLPGSSKTIADGVLIGPLALS